MIFAIWDWRKERFWCADAKGYTLNPREYGWYFSNQLPGRAGDCWIAIPRDSMMCRDFVKGLLGHLMSLESLEVMVNEVSSI
jgi:hypothetical protein